MKQAKLGWNFWLQWVLAYVLGSIVGSSIGRALGDALSAQMPDSIGGPFAAAIAGGLVGLALGFAEALVLGPYLKTITPWVVGTALGSTIGTVLGGILDKTVQNQLHLSDLLSSILGFMVVGLCIGFAQWWVAKEQFKEFSWWIVAVIVGLAFGPLVNLLALSTLSFVGPAVAFFVRPLVSGAVTGAILIGLLNPEEKTS
jgi:hypothetical protein